MTNQAFPPASRYIEGPRLLADIGCTNACFALETAPGVIESVRILSSADYKSIIEAVQGYFGEVGIERVHHAGIAIANPIDGDQVRMTNHHWAFSIEATRRELGMDTLMVVNDFTAMAMALPYLSADQRMSVGRGVAKPSSVIGLIGAGTGFGVSGLIPADDRWIALGSEGGHASFTPMDEREVFILQYAWREFRHVSTERLVTAPGLEVIYAALINRAKRKAQQLTADEIVRRGLSGECDKCMEALECFCGMLGAFAGNTALMLGALGGIYIGSGVVPRLGEYFLRSSFRERFESKGRFESYLSQIPTYVITAPNTALLGVAAILTNQLGKQTGESPVFDMIRQARSLSPAERRVADLALNHPRAVINDPIVDIARKANVSQPTVIRFCRSLGCQGLSDFKLKLASGLAGTIQVSHSQVLIGDSTAELSAKVLDNTMSAMLQTREHLNAPALDRAVELLDSARRIELYGVGNSRVVAVDGQYKFFRFGIPTVAHTDGPTQAMTAPLLSEGDVVIAISRSGRSAELLKAIKLALEAGASVIAITTRNSPLARSATVTLEIDHVEVSDTHVSMISRILALLMIDILAMGLAMRRSRKLSKPDAQGRIRIASHGAWAHAGDLSQED